MIFFSAFDFFSCCEGFSPHQREDFIVTHLTCLLWTSSTFHVVELTSDFLFKNVQNVIQPHISVSCIYLHFLSLMMVFTFTDIPFASYQ